MLFSVFAAGEPKGQPRPRAFSRNGHARVYDPGTAEGWKGAVALALRPYVPAVPVSCALRVRLDFFFGRPKSHIGARGLKSWAPLWHVGKPDADNAAKAVLDCCSAIGVWQDDTQVATLYVSKRYADRPGCLISLWDLDDVTDTQAEEMLAAIREVDA